MQTRKIFIGGWENTGTRLIVELLKYKGYNTLEGHHNKQYDYKHREMTRIVYDILFNNANPSHLIDLIKKDTFEIIPNDEKEEYEKIRDKYKYYVIKNGYLMLFIQLLKEAFPDSMFILCVRHPMDTLLKPSSNYKLFGKNNTEDPPITEKFKLYKDWYDKSIPYADYIIKLEDLLYDKEKTIYNLYKFLNIDTEINDDILNIIGNPSKNVGKSLEIMEYIKKMGY